MKAVELTIAALLLLAGLRSAWTWARRPFEGVDVVDHLLYAAYLTGRVGLWFSLAGFFLISASVETSGQPALDELQPYRWYLIVPMALAALQLVAGWYLGRREPRGSESGAP